MTKVFEKDLVLKKGSVFDESIEVKGSIVGKDGERFDLTVKGDINAWNIKADNINAGDIDALDINAEDINARDIKAGDIKAGDINAWDINAWDINAWDINAWDINAEDINARDIKAGDISYYAVCFAYNNISCKTIKGTRKNSKHFCLDGKIEQEAKKK